MYTIEYHTWALRLDIKYPIVLTKVEKMAMFFLRLPALYIFFCVCCYSCWTNFYLFIYKKSICIVSHINVVSIQPSKQQHNLIIIYRIKIYWSGLVDCYTMSGSKDLTIHALSKNKKYVFFKFHDNILHVSNYICFWNVY